MSEKTEPTDDYLEIGEELRRVFAWVDGDGKTTSPEAAIGAIGQLKNGKWWAVNFAGRDIFKVHSH